MKLIWQPKADADRERIWYYIEADNVEAAIRLDDEFDEMIEYALDHPRAFRAGRVPGTREIVVRDNYIMVYRIEDDSLVVLRIMHAAQQWP